MGSLHRVCAGCFLFNGEGVACVRRQRSIPSDVQISYDAGLHSWILLPHSEFDMYELLTAGRSFCNRNANRIFQTVRFLGVTENKRERDMDMREMTDKVKKGEPLYGISRLSDHHQAMAMRNSRYATFFLHVIPMFNFVNHNHVRLIP